MAVAPLPEFLEYPAPDTTLQRLWKIKSLAAFWGVSRPFLYGLVKSGQLRAVRLNGSLRVIESSAFEYLQRQRRAK